MHENCAVYFSLWVYDMHHPPQLPSLQEEVAMAAAADTRARIRAAGVGLSPLVGGGLGFTESSLEGSPPMAPWAFVPVAPMAGPM